MKTEVEIEDWDWSLKIEMEVDALDVAGEVEYIARYTYGCNGNLF